jgi:4-hydroxy-tetrahydrodipicolinate reductase
LQILLPRWNATRRSKKIKEMSMSSQAESFTLPAPGQTYRVVQWSTGNIGLRSLRAVIEHPRYELVGLWVHSSDKIGRDAGELCGLGPIGVKATGSTDTILALKPDCVLYMQQSFNLGDVCRLLAAGINIVTTRAEFHNPAKVDPAIRGPIEEACHRGGTTIHSTGSSPGFITEAVPIVFTSLSRRFDRLTIDEFGDVSSRNSPDLLFRVMGFGKPPGTALDQEQDLIHLSRIHSLALIAEAMAIPVDDFQIIEEVALARKTTQIVAGVIEAGTVAATRTTQQALRNGAPILRVRSNWYCTREIDPAWEVRETGWRLLLEGDTPLDVAISFPVPEEQWAAFTPGLTAHRAVNAVPYVCAAPPGIKSTVDLPQIIATF